MRQIRLVAIGERGDDHRILRWIVFVESPDTDICGFTDRFDARFREAVL